MRVALGIVLAAAVLSAIGLAIPRGASADTITTVTLDPSGPNQNLPLGSTFYLQGDVDSTMQAVAPVFVRYSFNVWDINPGFTCTDVATALGTPKDSVFTTGVTATKVSDLWSASSIPPGADPAQRARLGRVFANVSGAPVLVPGVWRHAPSAAPADAGSGTATFKVLVGPDFFLPGARYCMLVFESKPNSESEAPQVSAIVADAGARIDGCLAGTSGPAAGTACVTQAAMAARQAITTVVPKANASWINDELIPAASDVAQSAPDLQAISRAISNWIPPTMAIPGDVAGDGKVVADTETPPPGGPFEAQDYFATLTARLLIGKNLLYTGGEGAGTKFLTADGKIEVHALGILTDFSGVRVTKNTASLTPADRTSIPVALSGLMVPDTSVSLVDLIMLAKHQIAIGGKYVDLKDLPDTISSALSSNSGAATLTSIVTALTVWDDVLAVAARAAAGDPLHLALRDWLRTAVPNCNDVSLAPLLQGVSALACPPGSSPGLPTFGFMTAPPHPPGAAIRPFRALAEKITDAIGHSARLSAAMAQAVNKTLRLDEYGTGLGLQVQMSQKTFLTTYITPIVGFTYYASTRQGFWEPYVGIQVYAFPNPVDEPMWSNGSADLRRLFSLELGAGTEASGFGPGGRYATLNGVPPIFVGLAAQAIPYVTGSIGWSLLGTRSNELQQASTTIIDSLYFGLSVQANVPDIIRGLSTSGTSTQGASK
jgi:hypothetical protein